TGRALARFGALPPGAPLRAQEGEGPCTARVRRGTRAGPDVDRGAAGTGEAEVAHLPVPSFRGAFPFVIPRSAATRNLPHDYKSSGSVRTTLRFDRRWTEPFERGLFVESHHESDGGFDSLNGSYRCGFATRCPIFSNHLEQAAERRRCQRLGFGE